MSKPLIQIVNRWIRQILISTVQLLDSIEDTGENDEIGEDDKVGEFEKCIWVPRELKSGLGYQGTVLGYPKKGPALDYQDTLVSLKLL